MTEISTHKRIRVIKLFFTGFSYDEIARQLGIGKGSVVNIINEFREGDLPVSPDMHEYVDALRQVAVDIRKNNTNIAQVQSCLKIDVKLKEMDVNIEQVETWLDIVRDIASSSVSNNQFVKSALELAQVMYENSMSCEDVIIEYNTKINRLNEVNNELKEQEKCVEEVKSKYKEEKDQANRELEAINGAITTAQEIFKKQKEELQSALDEYVTQNKLSWKKINTTVALLDAGLSKSGLTNSDIAHLSERINYVGSIFNVIKQLEQQQSRLKSQVDELSRKEQTSNTRIKALENQDKRLQALISKNADILDMIEADLESERKEFEELKQTTNKYRENLYISQLIIDFLFLPNSLSNYDLDRLVSIMIGLRQKRLGIGPNQVVDSDGKVVCECQVPKMFGKISLPDEDIDPVRTFFAHLLTPLVKDKFISRIDYNIAELKHQTEVSLAIMQERNKHLT